MRHRAFQTGAQRSGAPPVEHRIDCALQIGKVQTGQSSTEDPYAGWRNDGLLAGLGQIVAFEREDGSIALITWDGECTKVWAKFNSAPLRPLVHMRKHMVEALAIDQSRPDGFIMVICFAR